MPHYETLSPLAAPLTYVLFAITWLSCIVCVALSIHFYRAKGQPWWLLIALAMALPLILEVTACVLHGLPPLPYRLHYPPQEADSTPTSVQAAGPGSPTSTKVITEYSFIRVQWSFGPPLIALALIWAYRDDKRKRG